LVTTRNARSPKTTWENAKSAAASAGSVVVVVVIVVLVVAGIVVVVAEDVETVAAGSDVSVAGGLVGSLVSPFPAHDARMITAVRATRRMGGSVHRCGSCERCGRISIVCTREEPNTALRGSRS
jgi:hypothetical protein